MADSSLKSLFCPVHMVWHEPGLTVCPIDDCRTKLEDGWNYRGMAGPFSQQIQSAKPPAEDAPKVRVPVWERSNR